MKITNPSYHRNQFYLKSICYTEENLYVLNDPGLDPKQVQVKVASKPAGVDKRVFE